MKKEISAQNDKLVKDFKSVIADAESFLLAAGNQAGEGMDELRSSMKSNIANAKDRLTTLEDELVNKAKNVAKVSDDYIREKPYQTALIAGGVGLVVGYLLSSRCK